MEKILLSLGKPQDILHCGENTSSLKANCQI